MLDTDTKEHQARQRQKNSPYKSLQQNIDPSDSPSTPSTLLPRFPESFETPVKSDKRNFSDTSFGAVSADATPVKSDKRNFSDTSFGAVSADATPVKSDKRNFSDTSFGAVSAETTPVKSDKRNFSDTSFGTVSAETTPVKLKKPEAYVQSLQNTFVNTIVLELWYGQIDVPWAKGRHMFLTYDKYFTATF
jgi:hypothetical protein